MKPEVETPLVWGKIRPRLDGQRESQIQAPSNMGTV